MIEFDASICLSHAFIDLPLLFNFVLLNGGLNCSVSGCSLKHYSANGPLHCEGCVYFYGLYGMV